jgi:antitoxin component YwqK of YwqJK toxin-antitoxin module
MKNIVALLLAMLAMNIGAQAQSAFTFYDYNWKECSASEARFASAVTKTDSGWLRKDYYLPKRNLQMQGLYKDSTTRVKNGSFYFFHSNGKLESKGVYRNNKKEGTWLRFHPNGAMSDSTVFDNGHMTGISIQWHNNSYESDSTNYDSDPVVHVSWHNDGSVSEAGRLDAAGNQIGKWRYYHRNGQVSADEFYQDGKLISVKYFAEDGSPVNDTSNKNHSAIFPGGVDAWLKFLGNKLYWPTQYQLVNGDLAAIGVQFTIDENGDVQDVFIFTPFEEAFNDIVIRAIKQSPKWKPAVWHNRRVPIVHRQTVNFKQETR